MTTKYKKTGGTTNRSVHKKRTILILINIIVCYIQRSFFLFNKMCILNLKNKYYN